MNTNAWNTNYSALPTYPNGMNYSSPNAQPQQQTRTGQFMFVNGRTAVDAWPMAPNGEMTFVDPVAMKLWIKKADGYGRPYDAEEYDLVASTPEVKTEPEAAPAPTIDMDQVRDIVSSEVDKRVEQAVSARLAALFGTTQSEVSAPND